MPVSHSDLEAQLLRAKYKRLFPDDWEGWPDGHDGSLSLTQLSSSPDAPPVVGSGTSQNADFAQVLARSFTPQSPNDLLHLEPAPTRTTLRTTSALPPLTASPHLAPALPLPTSLSNAHLAISFPIAPALSYWKGETLADRDSWDWATQSLPLFSVLCLFVPRSQLF